MAYTKNNEIISRIVHKHDTETNWNKAINFIPLIGEIIVYDTDENYNYERFKIGDGKTTVINLPFQKTNINDLKAVSYDVAQELTDEQKIQARVNIGAGEPQVQSDLGQTDETAKDYVKGVIRKESLPEGYPYKECEKVVIFEDNWLSGCSYQDDVRVMMNLPALAVPVEGETYTVSTYENSDNGFGAHLEDYEIVCQRSSSGMLSIGDPNLVETDFAFMYNEDSNTFNFGTLADTSSVYNNGVRIFSGFETIHTIAEEFLPDSVKIQSNLSQTDSTSPDYIKGVIRRESLPEGFPYKENTTILNITKVLRSASQNATSCLNPLKVDTTYSITIIAPDGSVKKESVYTTLSSDNTTINCGVKLENYYNCVISFKYYIETDILGIFISGPAQATDLVYTVVIEEGVPEVHKMSVEYLPEGVVIDTIPWDDVTNKPFGTIAVQTNDNSSTIIPPTVVTSSGMQLLDGGMYPGIAKYIVIFDGEYFECDSILQGSGPSAVAYCGNLSLCGVGSDNGLPFCLKAARTSSYTYCYVADPSVKHTIEAFQGYLGIKHLDDQYISDNIARKAYVDNQLTKKADSSHTHDEYLTEQIQSDLSQTDSTQPDYVKGVIRKDSLPEGYPYKEGVSIEWDGNTDGLHTENGLYLISEAIITNDEFKNGYITEVSSTYPDGQTLSVAEYWSVIESQGIVSEDYLVFPQGMIALIRKPNTVVTEANNATFEKAGVYVSVSSSYVSKISTGFTVKMSQEFLPDCAVQSTGNNIKIFNVLFDRSDNSVDKTFSEIKIANKKGEVVIATDPSNYWGYYSLSKLSDKFALFTRMEAAPFSMVFSNSTDEEAVSGTSSSAAIAYESFAVKDDDSVEFYSGSFDFDDISTKQDALTFDATPTEGSTNPVTSGGVKSYVDEAQVQSDLSQTDDTAADYVKGVIRQESLPEGYPYKEQSDVVLVEEEPDWHRNVEAVYCYTNGGVAPDPGATCIVTYDGQEYSCSAVVTNAENNIIALQNSDMPVEVAWLGHMNCYQFSIYNAGAKGSQYVKITTVSETIRTMAPEFLPKSAIAQEVIISDTEPTDETAEIWINTSEEWNDNIAGGVSSWNDLTDKPFDANNIIKPEALPEGYPYKESRVTVDVSSMLGPGAVLCKVSDDVPANVADFTGIKIWKNGEGVAVTPAIVNEMGYVDAVLGCVIACVDNANFDLDGMYLTIPETGVYLLKAESAGICMTGVAWDSTATQPDITWDGVVEIIHPIAPEFLPAGGGGGGAFYVKFTTTDNTNYTADKTFAEIVAADAAGQLIIGQVYNGTVKGSNLNLAGYMGDSSNGVIAVIFSSAYCFGDNLMMFTIMMQADGIMALRKTMALS